MLATPTIIAMHHIPTHWAQNDYDFLSARAAAGAVAWGKVVISDGGTKIPHIESLAAFYRNLVVRPYPLSELHDDLGNGKGRRIDSSAEAHDLGKRHAAFCNRIACDPENARFITKDRMLFEGLNEPELWAGEPPAIVAAYYTSFVNELHYYGLRAVALNLGVGWPGNTGKDTPADWTPFESVHKALGPGDRVGLHLYFGINGACDPTWLWHAGRYLFCPWYDVRFLATEFGLDGGVNNIPKQGWLSIPETDEAKRAARYIGMMAWAEDQMLKDGRFDALFVFTHDYADNAWEKFSTRNDNFMREFVKYARTPIYYTIFGDRRTARWELLIKQYASQFGLDPRVIAAIIAVESGGQVNALNASSLASGLMQVMPKEAGFPDRPTSLQLLNPDLNIEWGARILKYFIDFAQGDLSWGLARYGGAPEGPLSTAGKFYMSAFDKAFSDLFPGETNPRTGNATAPPASPPAQSPTPKTLLAVGEVYQSIKLNPDAALQRCFLADGFVPTSGEFDYMENGLTYVAQRAERLSDGFVRVYYCIKGDWGHVRNVER